VLLQAGASISTTSADGANAFVVALMEQNEEALALLRPRITAATANPRSDAGQPALVAVASEGDAGVLLQLISHGARVSDVGPDGVSVAHALAAAGAAQALHAVVEYVKGGAGGWCAVGSEVVDADKVSCASEVLSMVTAREQQHGEWRQYSHAKHHLASTCLTCVGRPHAAACRRVSRAASSAR
jgi:hypothetical protein